MKKKQKLRILELVIATIIIVIVTILVVNLIKNNNKGEQTTNEVEEEKFVQILENGMKLNVSTKLNEEKEFDGLKIKNIQLTSYDSQTLLTADIINNTGNDLGVTSINILLLNEQGETVATIPGVIGNVKAGETVPLHTETTLDFTNAYDFKIEIQK